MINNTAKEIIFSDFLNSGVPSFEIHLLDDKNFVKFTLRKFYRDPLLFSEDPMDNLSRLHFLYFNKVINGPMIMPIIHAISDYKEMKPLLSYLAWINSKNHRQCIFVQSVLNFIELRHHKIKLPMSNDDMKNINKNEMSIASTKTNTIENLFIGETTLSNTPQKAVELIADFFIISDATLESKINVIMQIKNMYASVSSENNIEEWIKREKKHGVINWLEQQPIMTNEDFTWLTSQKIAGNAEHFIVYLDLLFALKPDTAHLYTGRIKKAWSQKKTRDKYKTKAQYNFIMSPDIKSLLNEICEETHMPRNDLVELAIRNEYRRFKAIINEGS